MRNMNLRNAKKYKNDEFYTQLSDIEKEMKHYKSHFKDKVVFCNCDNPEWSNFWRYFTLNFDHLGLKKLIATHYRDNGKSYKLEFLPGDKPSFLPADVHKRTELQQNGDFRSPESIELLKEADIVVTNPPFSLFREYVAQLIEYKKSFLIIGSDNSITYKEIFPLIKDNNIWVGVNKVKEFMQPDGTIKKFGNISWFTNLPHSKRNEELILYQTFAGNEDKYPKYDNYDAIEVSKVKDIPVDYEGYMGVPITFLDKFSPKQFKIIGMAEDNGKGFSGGIWDGQNPHCVINGSNKFKRIFIKRKFKNEDCGR